MTNDTLICKKKKIPCQKLFTDQPTEGLQPPTSLCQRALHRAMANSVQTQNTLVYGWETVGLYMFQWYSLPG